MNASEPQMKAAIAAVETVEGHVFGGARRWRFGVDGRVARRLEGPDVDDLRFADMADALVRRPAARDPDIVTAESETAAVVVGKLATPGRLKARGYLLADGRPVTLKVWQTGADEVSLGGQERAVRRDLEQMPGFPTPRIVHDGRIGVTDYIVEPVVYGRHPLSDEHRVAAALDLTPALARSWRAWGPVDQPLHSVYDTGLWKRLRRVLADPALEWDPAWGSRKRVRRQVRWLIRRNRKLPCAPAHGDLVVTNIIRQPSGRHVLIDWEHGRHMPIAFDLTKLLLTSGRPREVNRRLAAEVRPFGEGRSRYSWDEQVALGLARMLSWSADQAARARKAGRLQQFEDNRRAQLALLVDVLGAISGSRAFSAGVPVR